jgi:hypothetical protein
MYNQLSTTPAVLVGVPLTTATASTPKETCMASDSSLIAWLTNYGQIVLFFAQIVFWLALGVAAVWATLIFRRYVNVMTAGMTPAAEASVTATPAATAAPTAVAPANDISVEEFVD